MQKQNDLTFIPVTPPDLERALMIREEAFDWLNTNFPGTVSFTTGNVLQMAGEKGKRWLIGTLRGHGIGDTTQEFSLPATADTLAILYLRAKGVKFREAVNSVVQGKSATVESDPKYGGVWNRLISIALKRFFIQRFIQFGFAYLYTKHTSEFSKHINPRIEIGCAVVTVNHCYGFTCGSRHHINFWI